MTNLRCVDGRIYRHDPQSDDPYLETDIGECPDCSGKGRSDDGEPVEKRGRSRNWMRSPWAPDRTEEKELVMNKVTICGGGALTPAGMAAKKQKEA